MSRYQKFAFGLTICCLSGQPMAGPIEQKWGPPLEGPFGLKPYIVSILHMQNQSDFKEQISRVGQPTAQLLRDIDVMPLLYTFDSLQSRRDIEDLAGLGAYYMGEAAGELYECLVLRKGEKIKHALENLAAKKSNECIVQFGPDSKICKADKDYRFDLNRRIETIRNLTKAQKVKVGCTTKGWSEM